MDITENKFKEEVNHIVSSLQKFLPKKNEISFFDGSKKFKLTRLTDFHAEAKNAFPKCFVGAQLVVFRDIMDKVKLVQQYGYGKSRESYRSYSQLIHKELEPKSTEEGLLIDSSGSATATYQDTLNGGYEMKLTSRIKDLVSSETEIVFEKDSERSACAVSCSVKDVDPMTLQVVTQWMYRLTPEISIGTEIGIKPLHCPQSPDFSMSSRYEKPSFALSTTISKRGFQLCAFKQFAPDLRLGTILTEGNREKTTTFSVALHKNYNNGSQLKIFVDSQRCGGFTFQKEVAFNEAPNEIRILRLIGSTLIDRQRRVRFGVGVNLDL